MAALVPMCNSSPRATTWGRPYEKMHCRRARRPGAPCCPRPCFSVGAAPCGRPRTGLHQPKGPLVKGGCRACGPTGGFSLTGALAIIGNPSDLASLGHLPFTREAFGVSAHLSGPLATRSECRLRRKGGCHPGSPQKSSRPVSRTGEILSFGPQASHSMLTQPPLLSCPQLCPAESWAVATTVTCAPFHRLLTTSLSRPAPLRTFRAEAVTV